MNKNNPPLYNVLHTSLVDVVGDESNSTHLDIKFSWLHSKEGGMIIHSILKILLIIDYKSVISIMLIIPEDLFFKHETANNVSDRKLFDYQMGGVPSIN